MNTEQAQAELIMVIDDQQVHLKLMERILTQRGWRVKIAQSRSEAFQFIAQEMPDLILLDVVLPEHSGFDICKEIKTLPGSENVPVIFMSSINDARTKVRAFDEGGADYITKPFSKEEVVARAELHLKIRQFNLNNTRYIGKLEKEREDYIAKLEAMNKEKDTMISIVSHDLRSPLGGIKVMAELLTDEKYCDSLDSVREFAEQIVKTVNSMTILVNNLLDVSRIESGELRTLQATPTNLTNIVEDIINMFAGSAFAKDITLTANVNEHTPLINGDPDKLTQVLTNLVNNAVKFTPLGGKVLVSVQPLNNEQVEIQVQDNGIGIPVAKINHLFRKDGLVQRKGTQGEKGVGLGLPLVHSFVTLHNGSITVESTEGQGTTFSIRLPINQSS